MHIKIYFLCMKKVYSFEIRTKAGIIHVVSLFYAN